MIHPTSHAATPGDVRRIEAVARIMADQTQGLRAAGLPDLGR